MRVARLMNVEPTLQYVRKRAVASSFSIFTLLSSLLFLSRFAETQRMTVSLSVAPAVAGVRVLVLLLPTNSICQGRVSCPGTGRYAVRRRGLIAVLLTCG